MLVVSKKVVNTSTSAIEKNTARNKKNNETSSKVSSKLYGFDFLTFHTIKETIIQGKKTNNAATEPINAFMQK